MGKTTRHIFTVNARMVLGDQISRLRACNWPFICAEGMWTHAHQNSDAPVLSATPSALQASITIGYVRDRNSHVRSCTLLAGSRILSRWPHLRPYVQAALALAVLISKSHGTIWSTYKVVQHEVTRCIKTPQSAPA
jgi:hypothetical protein